MNFKSLAISLVLAATTVLVHAAAEPTTIHEAAAHGALETVQQLIDLDPSYIHLTDHIGATPLHIAAAHGHVEIARLLLENGASIKQRDNNGHTPSDRASTRWVLVMPVPLLEARKAVEDLFQEWPNIRRMRAARHAFVHGAFQASCPISGIPEGSIRQIISYLTPADFHTHQKLVLQPASSLYNLVGNHKTAAISAGVIGFGLLALRLMRR